MPIVSSSTTTGKQPRRKYVRLVTEERRRQNRENQKKYREKQKQLVISSEPIDNNGSSPLRSRPATATPSLGCCSATSTFELDDSYPVLCSSTCTASPTPPPQDEFLLPYEDLAIPDLSSYDPRALDTHHDLYRPPSTNPQSSFKVFHPSAEFAKFADPYDPAPDPGVCWSQNGEITHGNPTWLPLALGLDEQSITRDIRDAYRVQVVQPAQSNPETLFDRPSWLLFEAGWRPPSPSLLEDSSHGEALESDSHTR